MPARQQEAAMGIMIVLRIMIIKVSTYWTSSRYTVLNSSHAFVKGLATFLMFGC